MSFPIVLGATSLGGPYQDPEAFLRLLRALEGEGGYSKDPESLRGLELLAWAYVMSVGAIALERAGEQQYPELATELLAEWERVLGLPNDTARTVLERQDRAQAARAMLGAATKATVELALERVAQAGITLHENTRAMVAADDASPEAIFQVAVQLADADFDDPASRSGVAHLLRRLFPMRARGQLGRQDVAGMLVTDLAATWGSASHRLGRAAIRQDAAAAHVHRRSPARLRDYGPLSRLDAGDLNGIQEQTLLGTGPGFATHDPGKGAQRAFAGNFVGIGTTTVDSSIDWRDRMIFVSAKAATGSDIRPGAAQQTSLNAQLARRRVWWTEAGGASYAVALVTGELELRVDSGTGALTVHVLTATTYSLVLMLIASGTTGLA